MNCITSVGIGSNYTQAIKRFEKNVEETNPTLDKIIWRNYPPNSPIHQIVPYAFKPYAIKYAIEKGYQNILWADSTLVALKSLNPFFEHIEKNGWLLYYNGFVCGEWITDAALKKHNLTRDEAMLIPDFTGCLMGFNTNNQLAMKFLQEWTNAANDNISFIGKHKNINNCCSSDPRCKGHRHDQVIGSIIVHKLKMKIWENKGILNYYTPLSDSTLIINCR